MCHAFIVSSNWGAGSAQFQELSLKLSHNSFTEITLLTASVFLPLRRIVSSELVVAFFINSSEKRTELLAF
ncbi:hypothetical protein D3C76_762830 [compost metagenome]